MKQAAWILLGLAGLAPPAASAATPTDDRPNILLIVADDLGYGDLGIYGSDIATPNIDALAERGLLFTQFHTSPYCAPTRAMLLSGNNNHVAGMGRQDTVGIRGHAYPGYEGGLSDRVVPFPRLLGEAGYHTSMVGKWHLGLDPEDDPTVKGFDRAFALLQGAATHFNAIGYKEGGSTYRENGQPTTWPEGRYSTDLYTDKLIGFIDEAHRSGRPFFAYAAYTSPHWPLQVPEEDLELYAGAYDDGYESLRRRRFASLQAAGIVPASWALPPANPAITPWEELSPEEQRRESREMELYAAMVDNLDRHVGRLLDHLRELGIADDTLVLFLSDNGAAGEDFYDTGRFVDYVRAHHDNAQENMGRESSFVSYGPAWAEAGSAPFQRYKGHTREGGVTAPMIVAGPGVGPAGTLTRAYVTVMDLAPTLLEVAGASYPRDEGLAPMLGASLRKLLAGTTDLVHGDDHVTVLAHSGKAMIRRGRWKLANLEGPFDEDDLELFDLEIDPGETTDLSAEHPEIRAELIELWRQHRKELGIVLPEDL